MVGGPSQYVTKCSCLVGGPIAVHCITMLTVYVCLQFSSPGGWSNTGSRTQEPEADGCLQGTDGTGTNFKENTRGG